MRILDFSIDGGTENVTKWLVHRYSGGPQIRFFFGGEGSLWILGFGVPSRPNPSSGALKSTLPGPREGSSILNAHLVVMSAAVPHLLGVCAMPVVQNPDFAGGRPSKSWFRTTAQTPVVQPRLRSIAVDQPYRWLSVSPNVSGAERTRNQNDGPILA